MTGEDVVEFQCHGGVMVASMILETLIDFGARLATPGEFSKRAFLNGRVDLTKAEAVARLIEAKSEDAVKILAKQVAGGLGEFINEARDSLIEIMAHIEVSIDYAEDDLPLNLLEKIEEKLLTLERKLENIIEISARKKGLISGFKAVILGKPNVGKSTLLNQILSTNRAIISTVAGTTRDTIEEEIRVGTHLIKIVDTAGIRESSDEVERIGIGRSKEAAKSADMIIALFDASKKVDEEDMEVLTFLEEIKGDKKCFYLLNKVEKDLKFDKTLLPKEVIEISATKDASPIIRKIREYLDTQKIDSEIILISENQIRRVKETTKALKESKEFLNEGSLELFSFHLHEAVDALGAITRPYSVDEVMDKMFSDFCLGK